MATTSPEAVRLAESFRQAETRQAALIAAAVALYFRSRVDAKDPRTIERWLAAMVPVILREQARSTARGVLYGNTVRTLEVGLDDGFRFEPVEIANLTERVRTSLVVTGQVGLQKRLEKISGQDISPATERALIEQAIETSAAAAGAAAARHVQSGGRTALADGVARDRRALGFARVTKPDPCYFCAMLASRGAVYDADSFDESDPRFTGAGDFKVHDSCGCSLKPIYTRSDPIVARNAEFEALWLASTPGTSGRGSIRAFRRAYEGR